jgi:hypothetical protein
MANFSSLMTKANDWKAMSYGDVAGFAGFGGKITHFKFHSPTVKKSLNFVLLEIGVGAEIKIGLDFISSLDSFLQNCNRIKEGATANSNYKALACYRAFSLYDVIAARSTSFDTSISSITGLKVSGLWVSSFDLKYCLFKIPAEVSPALGIGGGASVQGGIFVPFGQEISNVYMLDRYQREKNRKSAMEQIPRPAGGW